MKWLFALICLCEISAQSVFVGTRDISERVLINVSKFLNQSRKPLRQAIVIDVNSLDDPNSIKASKLLPLPELHSRLSQAGLNSIQKFLIVGKSTRGWGEEGRLLWILEQFFEVDVKILDGGLTSLQKYLDNENAKFVNKSLSQALLIKDRIGAYGISLEQLRLSTSPIIDVRGVLEYAGATPFGSAYGGHIKGAKSVPWDQFFDGEGYLREQPVFMITAKNEIPIVYCTAGYRSAMVWAVLKHFGIRSINYDGSWFEYSHHETEQANN